MVYNMKAKRYERTWEMGEAYDRTGAFLGAAEADSAREVLEKLELKHRDAAEFRIRTVEQMTNEGSIGTGPDRNVQAATPRDRMLQFFTHAHLPDHLGKVSLPFCQLAEEICATLPSNPERTVALRKLLEAKDCAVRALLYKG
jgi:hypothetical protein